MALVRDPVTGQLVDDGRPLPAGIAPNAAQVQAQNDAAARQRAAEFRSDVAALPRNTLAAAASVPLVAAGVATGAIPLRYESARPGRGDLQPTYAERLADYQSRQPSPLGAAEAQRVGSLAARAGADYRDSMQAQVRPPVSLMALQPPTVAGGTAQSSAPGGPAAPAPRNYDAEVAAAVRPADPVRSLSADQLPQRGVYAQYNTDLDALRRRALPTAGIDLGASALTAPQAAAPRGGLTVVGLKRTAEDMATSDNPFVRRAGMQRMAIEGAQRQQQMQNEGELARTRAAGEFGLQDTALRGQFGLQDTGLRGEYGLTERELANAGQLEAARQTGLASLAAAEARAAGTVQAAQLRQQGSAGTDAVRQANMALAQQLYREGADPATVSAALNGQLRPQRQFAPQVVNGGFGPLGVLDPNAGQIRDFTPEERAALQGNTSLYLPQAR